MAQEYVDRAYLSVDGTEIECEEITYRLSRDGQDTVKTMNRLNRGSGFSGGVVTAELTAQVPEPKGGHAVNFDQLLADGTVFNAVIEYEGGTRRLFRECRVRDVEGATRQGDKGMATLTIDCLKPSFEPVNT
jgi:hypothetical protein